MNPQPRRRRPRRMDRPTLTTKLTPYDDQHTDFHTVYDDLGNLGGDGDLP
ncbi:hypothetical protein [Streptomyces virginiae]